MRSNLSGQGRIITCLSPTTDRKNKRRRTRTIRKTTTTTTKGQ
jgi:hypothetical protein